MGAFSFVIGTKIFLQCDLMFDSNFSTAGNTPSKLQNNLQPHSLMMAPFRKHTNIILTHWNGMSASKITKNASSLLSKGIHASTGITSWIHPWSKPRTISSWITTYTATWCNFYCLRQTATASIEVVYILLRESNLTKDQDQDLLDFTKQRKWLLANSHKSSDKCQHTMHEGWNLTGNDFTMLWSVWGLHIITGKLGLISPTALWLFPPVKSFCIYHVLLLPTQ